MTILGVMLGVHVLLVSYAIVVQAPLVDEPKHLIAGAAHRRLKRFDIYTVNPPLARTIASLALDCCGLEVDWSQFNADPLSYCEASIACGFVEKNGPMARWAIAVARLFCLPFTILGAFVCYHWGKDLVNSQAGLVASACWCFCPDIIGFAGVLLPDLPASAMGITSAWRYWHWLRRPNWKSLLLAAISLGLAFLTKSTLIILAGVWCGAWVAHRLGARSNRSEETAASFRSLVILLTISIYVLNLGYCFHGTGKRLEEFEFVSPTFSGRPPTYPWVFNRGNRFRGTWLAAIPLPLPSSFLTGIDLQKRDFDLGMQSYLRGSWAEQGWWYYYLYALLIKVPVPVFLLGVIASTERVRTSPRPGSRISDRTTLILLLGPPLLILTIVSSQAGFSHHLRYVLPAFPFAFVMLGPAAGWWRRSRWQRTILTVLLAWLACEGILSCPHGTSYFNELVGGSKNGHRHLLHSNCDWGQDLFHLDRWVMDHPDERPLLIDYYGLTPADAYGGFKSDGVRLEVPGGLRFESLLQSGERFWIGISVTRLTQGNPAYRLFDGSEPCARIGDSILIFEVPASRAPSFRSPSIKP